MSADIARAVELLRAGELVAFPTETVYGLGADASNSAAVAKIFSAKGRPQDHPLIVHLPGVEHLERWAREIPEKARALAEAFWPGPLTMILKRQPTVPDAITGGQDTVGLRVPNHPLALELLQAFDGGIAAPSANRFGHVSPTTAQHVADELGDELLVLDGGACEHGIESAIVDCSGAAPALLRPGVVSRERLEQALGAALREPDERSPGAPGTLESHYAPRATLRLMSAAEMKSALQVLPASIQGLAVYSRTAPRRHPLVQVMPDDPRAVARELFAVLRAFDARGVKLIWVEQPPDTPEWEGVNDRLQRAAAH